MRVEHTHHIDEVPGQRYEYDLFRFSDEAVTLVVRGYAHDPAEAQFLRVESATSSRGITHMDLKLPLFRTAAQYLRSVGRTSLQWLNVEGSGYEPLLDV
jgi:hypothetical protein